MLQQAEQEELLSLAKQSVHQAVTQGIELSVDTDTFLPSLHCQRACFVTLKLNARLRGCIGSLEAYRPLVLDVVHNAFAAALHDSRFKAVSEVELKTIDYEISVLSPAVNMKVASQQQLLDSLLVGEHGVILQSGSHRATYLPSVWQQLPDPVEFIRELKIKAGLPGDYWSDDIKIATYITQSFSN